MNLEALLLRSMHDEERCKMGLMVLTECTAGKYRLYVGCST